MKRLTKQLTVIFMVIFAAILLFQGCLPPEIESTKLYLQKKQYDEAEKQAELAVQKYPQNPMAYLYLGKVKYEKGDYKAMVEAFDKAESLGLSAQDAKDVENYKKSAFAKSYNAAVKYIKDAQNIEDEAKKKELYVKAFEQAKYAFYTNPEFFSTYNILIQLAINLDKKDEAKEFMVSAEKQFAKNDTVLFYVSKGYMQLGDIEKAFELLKKAEKINPNNIDVVKLIIDYYLNKEDYSAAEAYLKKLVENMPEDPNVIYTVAAVYYKEEKFSEAAIYFEKLVQLVEDNSDYWVLYVNSLLQANQAEKAVKASEEALELFEDNADLWQQYAIALVRTGKIQEAKKAEAKYQELKSEE
jgi:tetratricopeptide (TPR) repeat protein